MIIGIFHEGSGLGNQLARYVFTRVKALDLCVPFGMIGDFKGKEFMNLDIGESIPENIAFTEFFEKKVVENGIDIRGYDPEVNFIKENTVVDGEFQDERYWGHREDEVREWLSVEPLEMPHNLCVINFRGGEYTIFPDLFLTKDYWDKAIKLMKEKYWHIEFEVHTDDPITARQFFPHYKVIQDMGLNWRSIRYAKHLILSNSSFAILPAWLNEDVEEIIAPRYWARHNIGTWAQPANYYKKFTYI